MEVVKIDSNRKQRAETDSTRTSKCDDVIVEFRLQFWLALRAALGRQASDFGSDRAFHWLSQPRFAVPCER